MLKNTIDWASSPVKGHPEWQDGTRSFRGKVVGMLSASPGALGGLRSQSHLGPLLTNLECWLAPKAFALGSAGSAFDESGALVQQAHRDRVRAVVDQVLWAAERLQSTSRVSIQAKTGSGAYPASASSYQNNSDGLPPGCGACCIALPFPPHSEDAPRQAGGRAVRAPHAQPGVRSVRQPRAPRRLRQPAAQRRDVRRIA